MTLSIIGDRSTLAAMPHKIESLANNAANETLLSNTHCSKKKIADENAIFVARWQKTSFQIYKNFAISI
jgi:hypothetical protein